MGEDTSERPPAPEPLIGKPRVLLAEGFWDKAFFDAFLKDLAEKRGFDTDDIQVSPRGGKENLGPTIKEIPRSSWWSRRDRLSLAIMRDADVLITDPDDNPDGLPGRKENAFQSICDALESAGLPKPGSPGSFATHSTLPVRVGVFLLPDNTHSGCLETLCYGTVQEKPENDCIQEFLACAERAGLKPKHLHKARAQAWLAVQEEPGLHVGRAAQRHLWPFDHRAFDGLRDFLLEWITGHDALHNVAAR